MAEKKPRPHLDCKKCTKSFVCVSVCPVQIFKKESDDKCPKIVKPETCINCMACETNCPSGAIKVK